MFPLRRAIEEPVKGLERAGEVLVEQEPWQNAGSKVGIGWP